MEDARPGDVLAFNLRNGEMGYLLHKGNGFATPCGAKYSKQDCTSLNLKGVYKNEGGAIIKNPTGIKPYY